jgi:ribosomal protein L40E
MLYQNYIYFKGGLFSRTFYRLVNKLKKKIFQKFCRECYTTTPHKAVQVTDLNTVRMYEKVICLKCSKAKAYKKAMPTKKAAYEDFLEI